MKKLIFIFLLVFAGSLISLNKEQPARDPKMPRPEHFAYVLPYRAL